MTKYVVTTMCVIEAATPLDAALEADEWNRNNNIYTVDEPFRTYEVDVRKETVT